MPNHSSRAGLPTLEQADVELGEKLAGERKDPTVQKMVQVGKLGDQGPLYAMAATTMLVSQLAGSRRLARAGVSMLFAVGLADVLKRLAKKSFHRTRPHVEMEERTYRRGAGGSPRKPEQSFPSGHTTCTVAAACALARHYPASAPWSTLFAATIATARLAKGAHWPLDVAAGSLLGVLAEALSRPLARAAQVAPRG